MMVQGLPKHNPAGLQALAGEMLLCLVAGEFTLQAQVAFSCCLADPEANENLPSFNGKQCTVWKKLTAPYAPACWFIN